MLRWTDGGHFWTAQRRSPHPPLRPVRHQQPGRNDRAGARTSGLGHRRARCFDKSSADRRDRSTSAGGHPAMPLLRQSHVHHRDLRGRLPTTSQAGRTARRNQHRYVMTPSASSRTRTAGRLPPRSSTGHAGTRPHARSASHSSPRSSPTGIVIKAESNPSSRTSSRTQPAQTPNRFAQTSAQRSNRHR